MRALGILAVAPIPGKVKLRLAEDAGPSAASEVYWRVGRRVVAAVVGAGHRTTVWYRPPEERAFVREWLAEAGSLVLRPQVRGDLGARLAAAFTRHFQEGADRGGAVIIGTDCPGVDRRLVVEAFRGLGAADIVLGPTVSGGIYLVGLSAPAPALFRDVPWATEAVAAQLRARAQAQGLRLYPLPPLRGIDTARDARALGYLKS